MNPAEEILQEIINYLRTLTLELICLESSKHLLNEEETSEYYGRLSVLGDLKKIMKDYLCLLKKTKI